MSYLIRIFVTSSVMTSIAEKKVFNHLVRVDRIYISDSSGQKLILLSG